MEKFEIIDVENFAKVYNLGVSQVNRIAFVEIIGSYFHGVYVRLYRISGKTGKPYVWLRETIQRKFLIPYGLEVIDEC